MNCKESNFDYIIKKNDTKPYIKYLINDCDDTDLSDDTLFISASMWASSNLKNKISPVESLIELKNNYNLEAVKIEDYLLIKKYNESEHVLVTDINNTFLSVTRSQLGSSSLNFSKGDQIKIIKFYEVEAEKEIEYNNSLNINGEQINEVASQNLIYKWRPGDTSSPGIFFLEFKVTKIVSGEIVWTKKYPNNKEGISIKITNENLEV